MLIDTCPELMRTSLTKNLYNNVVTFAVKHEKIEVVQLLVCKFFDMLDHTQKCCWSHELIKTGIKFRVSVEIIEFLISIDDTPPLMFRIYIRLALYEQSSLEIIQFLLSKVNVPRDQEWYMETIEMMDRQLLASHSIGIDIP